MAFMNRLEHRLSRLEALTTRRRVPPSELAAVVTKIQAGIAVEALSDEELQVVVDSGPDLSHVPDDDLDAIIAGDDAAARRYGVRLVHDR